MHAEEGYQEDLFDRFVYYVRRTK